MRNIIINYYVIYITYYIIMQIIIWLTGVYLCFKILGLCL